MAELKMTYNTASKTLDDGLSPLLTSFLTYNREIDPDFFTSEIFFLIAVNFIGEHAPTAHYFLPPVPTKEIFPGLSDEVIQL